MTPMFTELARMGSARNSRGGQRPRYFLLHTQEGNGTAESLAAYLNNTANSVSYHYTLDNSVTVVDVVDTDYASWSVGGANAYSINLCFAGSRAVWTRAQWLNNMGRAIDVAAYLCAQDCKKYGIPARWLGSGGNYRAANAGVSDHQYVTSVIGWGTHTDVGRGFPADVFATALTKYMTDDDQEDDMASNIDKDIRQQITGSTNLGSYPGWPQLGDRTLVDAVAAIGEKLGVADCYDTRADRNGSAAG